MAGGVDVIAALYYTIAAAGALTAAGIIGELWEFFIGWRLRQ
jgi:hypothetical protein